jgi:hypothetical protein
MRKRRRVLPNGSTEKGDRFFMLTFSMGRSLAWRSLSGAAVKVFIELRCHFNGHNNGVLFLSYGDASKHLHLSRSTVKRAFDELQEKGFVRKTRQGARHCRLASTWAVTDRPLKEGEPPTYAWRRWQPAKNKTSVLPRHSDASDGAIIVPIERDCAA